MADKPDDLPLDAGELEAFLYFGCSSGTTTPPMVRSLIRRACIELLSRRQAELTSFNKMQLSVLRDRLTDYTEDVSIKELLTRMIGDGPPPSLVLPMLPMHNEPTHGDEQGYLPSSDNHAEEAKKP